MMLAAVLLIPLLAAGVWSCTPALALAAAITLGASAADRRLVRSGSLRRSSRSGPIDRPCRAWLSCDALGALVLLLVAFVGATAALFSLGYHGRPRPRRRPPRRAALLRAFQPVPVRPCSLVPLIAQIALMWIAVELTTLFSVLPGRLRRHRRGARGGVEVRRADHAWARRSRCSASSSSSGPCGTARRWPVHLGGVCSRPRRACRPCCSGRRSC